MLSKLINLLRNHETAVDPFVVYNFFFVLLNFFHICIWDLVPKITFLYMEDNNLWIGCLFCSLMSNLSAKRISDLNYSLEMLIVGEGNCLLCVRFVGPTLI